MTKLDSLRLKADTWGLFYLVIAVCDKIFRTNAINKYKQKILEKMNPEDYPRLLKNYYMICTGLELNMEKLESFNEKIQWIKINDISPLKTMLSDKYLVRQWIKEKIGDQYLIPIIGVWDSFDEIDFDSLPEKFFLKCNHGFGFNYPIKNKKTIDKRKLRLLFDNWLNQNYAFNSLEMQYKDISRKIIAEQYLEEADGNLFDYKIHVFRGEPMIIQVIGDRDILRHTAKECFFTTDWIPHNLMYHTYDMYDIPPQKPLNLDEMLDIARVLGSGFRYVRVDLYNLDGHIKFGEMTFTPASGYGKWDGDEQYLVGSWIDISD